MSPKKKTYVAIYERDKHDDAWNVRIDSLEGCQTYGRSLRQAQGRIREAGPVIAEICPQEIKQVFGFAAARPEMGVGNPDRPVLPSGAGHGISCHDASKRLVGSELQVLAGLKGCVPKAMRTLSQVCDSFFHRKI